MKKLLNRALFLCLLGTNIHCIEKIGRTSIEVAEFIKNYLPENPLIFEAGANRGEDTKVFASFWPKSTIFAFEPVPELYTQIKKNNAGFKNVKVYPFALSDKIGSASFFVSEIVSRPGIPYGSGSLLTPHEHLKRDSNIVFPERSLFKQQQSMLGLSRIMLHI